MLLRLSIKNIVLVDYVTIDLKSGFSIFTGETGAGKSIILDSLFFVLGGRANKDFVCSYAEDGEVIACIDISKYNKIKQEFRENTLTFKRIQSKNGRTQCFLNDKAVSLSYIRDIGNRLVQFHGQHADRDLLKKTEHLRLLDNFAGLEKVKLEKAYEKWLKAQKELEEKLNVLEEYNKEQDYLKNAVIELENLFVKPGEEEELSSKRALMLKHQKLANTILEVQNSLSLNNSPSSVLTDLWRKLDRGVESEYTKIIIEHMDNVLHYLAILEDSVGETLKTLYFDESELEAIEERLFALRAAARKYNIRIDDLPELYEKMSQKVRLIENAESEIKNAQSLIKKYKNEYLIEANLLSKARKEAAEALTAKIMAELPDLKLEHSKFFVKFDNNANIMTKLGIDKVEFWVQTNPNTNAGPILEVASGGELSRFLLALKVVLFNKNKIPTLIFDEIDTGVGGAVAASIGKKLKMLAKNIQLIAITHLPQVASMADNQFLITKVLVENENRLTSKIIKLNKKERIEEIARMLSGSKITAEARASAQSLINIK